MTFLEMCRALVEKCSISGAMSSVENQRGEMLRVVNWINEAWWDLQVKNSNWKWMTYDFTLTTQVGVQAYLPSEILGIQRFRKWRPDTLLIQKRSTGASDNHELGESDWEQFRRQYVFGVVQPAYPSTFAIHPRTDAIHFGATPDDAYDVFGDYQRMPYRMSGNTDVPDLPESHHMIIVHAARMKYALFENAAEVLAEATNDYQNYMRVLTEDQLPQVGTGDPLA